MRAGSSAPSRASARPLAQGLSAGPAGQGAEPPQGAHEPARRIREIKCTDRDAPFVLDGVLYHESDLDCRRALLEVHERYEGRVGG